jgi:hypothetical protein
MYGPNFDPVLAYSSNGMTVIGMGPLGQDRLARGAPLVSDHLLQLRAWIFQRADNGTDAVATGDGSAAVPGLREAPGVCWLLPLTKVTNTGFVDGRGFAVAIALVQNGQAGATDGRVIWWGQPVELRENDPAVGLAMSPLYAGNPAAGFIGIKLLLGSADPTTSQSAAQGAGQPDAQAQAAPAEPDPAAEPRTED